ncbi:MAG TPA: prolyl oligopeptidase family serine peptidase [Vicinamibacterales bacterium]|nr:prolyl oligopeptidase family serine peptidase [Vicinamibacterales bacterium]
MKSLTLPALFVIMLFATAPLPAQQPGALESGYQLPPRAIVDILDAPPPPTAVISPAANVMALLERANMPAIADLAAPMLRLAGARINPKTNGPHSPASILGITFKRIADGVETRVALPPDVRIGSPGFSPDGKWLSFTVNRSSGVELWMADTASARARAVTAATVNALGGCSWLQDSSAMLCHFVVTGRGPAPAPPAVPTGPRIQENIGRAAPAPTFQDLLTSAHDEALFEHYFTSQLATVTPAGAKAPIGRPAIFATASMSPDGQFVLVSRIKRPFSRLVTASGFAKDVEIWSRKGDLVRTIGEQPLAEGVPIGGVVTGPRSHRWNPTVPATLLWVEALDNGDPRNQVPARDKVMSLAAASAGAPAEFARTAFRFTNVSWTEKGVALLSESDRATRVTRTWLIDAPGAAPRRLWERKQQDRYSDPGVPMMRPGGNAILQAGDTIYLTGSGASPLGDRPFLDRLNLTSLATERVFQTDDRSYETVAALFSDDAKRLLTRRETRTDFPNYHVRDLAAGTLSALTRFKDPAPQLTGIQKQLVTYDRKDGVTLSATVYLPPDYKPGTRLPFVLWAYPAEFTDAATASQVSGSPNRFTTISGASHLLFLTQGYGVMDNPTMPIVGPGETANDTYVEQLMASAEAAIDKIVGMGVADRDRIGVAGHSYGAFMTANLLAHGRLFRAGTARSGAYNRTLTPFGFQNEQRTFWEVPEIYGNLSPFFHAHKIEDPILLIHGEADNNSGTFPVQSERFYLALKGNGKTVRYVTLPLESHGYASRESNMHVLYEWLNWFDTYVKHAKPR